MLTANICVAGELEDALAAIANAGNARDISKGSEGDITNKSAELKPIGGSDMDAQLAQIEANYKAQIDAASLMQNHDPLKSDLSNFNANYSSASIAQDIQKITDKQSDTSAKFKIAKNDKLLTVAQDIEAKTIVRNGDIITPESMGPDAPPKDKIVTCREAGDKRIKKCYRTLIVTARQPEDIKFETKLYFSAHSRVGHSTTANLKTGQIRYEGAGAINSSSRIENAFDIISPGAQIISIRHLGGDWWHAAGVHTHEVYPDSTMPTEANGYVYKNNISQGAMGSKKKQRANGDKYRGRTESWEVVARPAPVLVDSWDDGGCEKLAKYSQKNLCQGPTIKFLDVGVSREIAGYPSPVTRNHWQEQHTYSCGGGGELVNECTSLLASGCTQVKSQCIEKRGSFCVQYLQTYNCGKNNTNTNLKIDGAKMSLSAEQNIGADDGFEVEDFGNAVAQLSMVEEIRKNIVRDGDGNVLLFKGDRLSCDKFIASDIKNCCNLGGIFKNIIGHKCPQEVEEVLAPAVVREKRCVQLGTEKGKEGWYRVSKTIRRKTFCCYQSRLARIFQQIAHKQLGISWGTPEQPNCGPLDPSTFGRLNFDDPFARNLLKELVDEVSVNAQKYANTANAKLSNNGDLSEKVKSLQDRIGAYYERNTASAEPKL